jgi:hypothetical protein
MQVTNPQEPGKKLLHSIHNTSRATTKVALVKVSHYDDALGQLTNIQNIFSNQTQSTYRHNIFIPDAQPSVSGPRVDSISSCNQASFALDLL